MLEVGGMVQRHQNWEKGVEFTALHDFLTRVGSGVDEF